MRSGLDAKTNEYLGKLLVSVHDENLVADGKSYSKLYKMTGGTFFACILVTGFIFNRYFILYRDS